MDCSGTLDLADGTTRHLSFPTTVVQSPPFETETTNLQVYAGGGSSPQHIATLQCNLSAGPTSATLTPRVAAVGL